MSKSLWCRLGIHDFDEVGTQTATNATNSEGSPVTRLIYRCMSPGCTEERASPPLLYGIFGISKLNWDDTIYNSEYTNKTRDEAK